MKTQPAHYALTRDCLPAQLHFWPQVAHGPEPNDPARFNVARFFRPPSPPNARGSPKHDELPFAGNYGFAGAGEEFVAESESDDDSSDGGI